MKKPEWVEILLSYRAIAVIRADNVVMGKKMAQAVAKGGMKLIEITWNSEKPTKLVEELREELTDCRIGVGTIIETRELKEAIACGAEFCFSPYSNYELIEMGNKAEIPIIPGALSPTEIVKAWQGGASSIKVFPVESLGGAKYIKSLQIPLGKIPLIPTGGVTITNAAEYIKSGAIAVGLSSSLYPSSLVNQEAWSKISQRAKQLNNSIIN